MKARTEGAPRGAHAPRPVGGAAGVPTPLETRRLLHWGDLDERRRRRLGRWRWLARALAGGALAAVIAREVRVDPVAASRIVLAAIVAMYTWVMLGTPFRMYWRPDSPLLARLPIPGRALFEVALVRSVRAALGAALVVGPGVVALAALPEVGRELALRHAAVLGAVAAASALLLPAIALGAGALVAGGKAAVLFEAVGGAEMQAPPTAWLGVLPGLAASGVVLAVIGAARWAIGAPETMVGPAEVVLGGLAGASVLAALAARLAAAAVMPQAVREVAALDVQRLAHLDVHPPTRLERAIGARLGDRAARVHGKDARLLRRRYPMALVAGAATTGALWIIAAARPDAAWVWAVTIVGAFAAYALVVATRLTARPIELPYIRTLPFTRGDLVRAKRAYLATWTLLYPVLGAIPIAIRIPDGPVLAAVLVAGGVVAALGGGALVGRQHRASPADVE